LANKVKELRGVESERNKLRASLQDLEREAETLNRRLSAVPKVQSPFQSVIPVWIWVDQTEVGGWGGMAPYFTSVAMTAPNSRGHMHMVYKWIICLFARVSPLSL
jgi:hypothetical protein